MAWEDQCPKTRTRAKHNREKKWVVEAMGAYFRATSMLKSIYLKCNHHPGISFRGQGKDHRVPSQNLQRSSDL